MDKIILSGGISPWWVSAQYLRDQLKGKGDVDIYLSSFGGSVFEGIEMFNIIKNHPGHVTITVTSKAMSIASLFLLAADTKKAYKNATVMGHKSWTVAIGNMHEMTREASILSGIDNVIAKEYASHNGKTVKENLDMMRDEMWYIGEDQLKDSGFIDEIIDATPEESDDSTKEGFAKFKSEYMAEYLTHERPDLDAAENAVVACGGECTLEKPQPANAVTASGVPEKESKTKQGASMTLEELQAEHPELVASLEQAAAEDARQNERERFAAVYSAIPKAMRDNEKVMEKANDASTTIESMKAFMYDIGQAAIQGAVKGIDSANDTAMMGIDATNTLEEPEEEDENVQAVKNLIGGDK